MDQYLQIFALAQKKNTLVEEAYGGGNCRRELSVDVTRILNDWEVEEYEVILQLLATVKLTQRVINLCGI